MKRPLFLFLIIIFAAANSFSQSTAQKRAGTLKLGMNLSYLDNWWLGSKEKNFSDFAKPEEVAKRKEMLADIAKAGFSVVRLPVCYSAWMQLNRPYNWENVQGPEFADLLIKSALANGLKVVIDLHHTEFDGSIPEAANQERILTLWLRIAEKYKNTDPEKVFFELRNEPHDIAAGAWRSQAKEIIKTVREIVPKHTLIVGFHDWNSRKALVESEPFDDSNIIYTFHYYDPFIFTHQGATWAGEGLSDLKNISFPWLKESKIVIPEKAKGKWVEGLINNYREDTKSTRMFSDLKAAKDWSEKHGVPIFLGEFGSFSKVASMEDRCRHAQVIYSALGKLQIPNAWWEWDGGFSMFKPGTNKISDCMRRAIDSYRMQNQA